MNKMNGKAMFTFEQLEDFRRKGIIVDTPGIDSVDLSGIQADEDFLRELQSNPQSLTPDTQTVRQCPPISFYIERMQSMYPDLDERTIKRKAQGMRNRESAHLHRLKKQEYMLKLEGRINELEKTIEILKHENYEQKMLINSLRQQLSNQIFGEIDPKKKKLRFLSIMIFLFFVLFNCLQTIDQPRPLNRCIRTELLEKESHFLIPWNAKYTAMTTHQSPLEMKEKSALSIINSDKNQMSGEYIMRRTEYKRNNSYYLFLYNRQDCGKNEVCRYVIPSPDEGLNILLYGGLNNEDNLKINDEIGRDLWINCRINNTSSNASVIRTVLNSVSL